MEPISQRLKIFLQHRELTTTAFCRLMQYRSCEKIARLFRLEGAKPSVDIIQDIARYFPELNLRWLLLGEGDMLPDADTAENDDENRLMAVSSMDMSDEEELETISGPELNAFFRN